MSFYEDKKRVELEEEIMTLLKKKEIKLKEVSEIEERISEISSFLTKKAEQKKEEVINIDQLFSKYEGELEPEKGRFIDSDNKKEKKEMKDIEAFMPLSYVKSVITQSRNKNLVDFFFKPLLDNYSYPKINAEKEEIVIMPRVFKEIFNYIEKKHPLLLPSSQDKITDFGQQLFITMVMNKYGYKLVSISKKTGFLKFKRV